MKFLEALYLVDYKLAKFRIRIANWISPKSELCKVVEKWEYDFPRLFLKAYSGYDFVITQSKDSLSVEFKKVREGIDSQLGETNKLFKGVRKNNEFCGRLIKLPIKYKG